MDDPYPASKRSRFRFKSKDESRSKGEDREKHGSSDKRRYHHRHHHRSKRPKSSHPEPDEQAPYMDPNAAFRESLFDALADDEGAQYWESVYGQPIHTYSRPGAPNAQGELEQMDDEEYATYVRAKMWEKTHQGLLEERERRQREREKANERAKQHRKRDMERDAFDRMVNESLQRGRNRQAQKRESKRWTDIWKKYLDSWEDLNNRVREASSKNADEEGSGASLLRNLIVWPVESGKRNDITPKAVEEFIRRAPIPTPTDTPIEGKPSHPSDFLTVLKVERVRWHPDKVQHRYSKLGMEEQLIRSATEVFQILDRLWTEERQRQGKT